MFERTDSREEIAEELALDHHVLAHCLMCALWVMAANGVEHGVMLGKRTSDATRDAQLQPAIGFQPPLQ